MGEWMDDQVELWSATDQAHAIRGGSLTSRELLERILDRIRSLNPALNAVVTLDEGRARRDADAADEEAQRGAWRGPLHGLPITVKDALEVMGMRSTGGAQALADHIPERDASAVQAVRNAGAVIIGKTNVPEWSGDIQTFNQLFGTTHNPWDTGRVPGGSSGGAATAVACGMSAFEIGTDIGGSIRNPAHFVGIYGHKPSFGLVPQRGYLDHVGGGMIDADLNVVGPLARSAEDLSLLLNVIAGPPPELAPAWSVRLPQARGTAATDYRVAVWFDDAVCPLGRDVAAALHAAADRAADAGARVTIAQPPVDAARQRDLFMSLITAAVSVSAPDPLAELMGGSHHAWLILTEERARLAAAWADWFQDFDVLLCPVMPTTAFAHDEQGSIADRTVLIDGAPRPHFDLLTWVGMIGVIGLPATVVPLPQAGDGLPVGVQVVAPYLRDLDAITFGGVLAQAAGGGYSPPPMARR